MSNNGQSDAQALLGEATRRQLRHLIERIERVRAEKAELAADEKEVFAEAKAFGFDTKVMRAVLKQRAADPHERAEFEAMLDLYLDAVSFDSTPLGAHASVEAA